MEYRRLEYSQQVSIEGICVQSVTLGATSGGRGLITLRDGEGENANQVITLDAPASEVKHYPFTGGLCLSGGCYVELVQNIDEALIVYYLTGRE